VTASVLEQSRLHHVALPIQMGVYVASEVAKGLDHAHRSRDEQMQPLGIVRMISMLSSLGEVPAEIAFCFATGNTARMRELDCGLIEPGRAADFVFMDKAQHSAGKTFLDSIALGDLPGIGMVVIDGVVRSGRSRNTPPAEKIPVVVK